MKTRIALWLGLGITLLTGGGVANAGVLNGSFESWNLLGWNFTSDSGDRATEPLTRPAGSARTVANWGVNQGLVPQITPAAGYRFLLLNTRANGNFLGNDNYDLFVSQTLTLNQGEYLTGWSFFFDGDSEPLDSAWVRVRDDQGDIVALPWLATSGAPAASAPELGSLSAPYGWFQWQWAVPTTGSYTVQLGMSTSGANNNASFGLFDGVNVQTVPIPEPTSMALAMVGGLVLVILRNRNR